MATGLGCVYRQAPLTDAQRMMLDAQRQMAGNQALAKLRAEGVPCGTCGALNPVADPAAVQVVCPSRSSWCSDSGSAGSYCVAPGGGGGAITLRSRPPGYW
jgi:hypothetical protein